MDMFIKLFGGWVLSAIVVAAINLAILGAAVWIVVKILQATGVL